MRNTIIAGNWKMNKTPSESVALAKAVLPLVADAKGEVVLCPPFTSLYAVGEAIKGSNVKLGAQNVHFAASGAYTGEVSAQMLVELGVSHVIIGHSERRQYFNETDETVNKKVKAVLDANMTPILCCGETEAQRESDESKSVVGAQIRAGLEGLTALQAASLVIAYEPIWAIGTGKTATSAQAEEMNGFIRSVVAELFGKDCADAVRIQYGGSMNAANAAELMSMPDIDGGLIGGASLKPEDFAKVVHH